MVDCRRINETDNSSEDSIESDCRNRITLLKIDTFSLFLFSDKSQLESKTS